MASWSVNIKKNKSRLRKYFHLGYRPQSESVCLETRPKWIWCFEKISAKAARGDQSQVERSSTRWIARESDRAICPTAVRRPTNRSHSTARICFSTRTEILTRTATMEVMMQFVTCCSWECGCFAVLTHNFAKKNRRRFSAAENNFHKQRRRSAENENKCHEIYWLSGWRWENYGFHWKSLSISLFFFDRRHFAGD